MGRHNHKPDSTAPLRIPRRPASPSPKRLSVQDLLTVPMVGLIAAVALVLGVLVGLLIS